MTWPAVGRGSQWPATTGDWIRFVAGLAAVFALFHAVATRLGSDRGQAGAIVAALVLGALLVVERLLVDEARPIVRRLGLGVPTGRGIAAAIATSLALLLTIPTYAAVASVPFSMYPDWWRLVPGLFAQAGIAEETLFRGYLFGHLRQGRSFWPAAWLSLWPFVLVHVMLFAIFPWPIALASLALAAASTFPLAHLYELGGGTIWAPAILHFVIQAAVKIAIPQESSATFAIVWMSAAALLPFAVFLWRAPRADAP